MYVVGIQYIKGIGWFFAQRHTASRPRIWPWRLLLVSICNVGPKKTMETKGTWWFNQEQWLLNFGIYGFHQKAKLVEITKTNPPMRWQVYDPDKLITVLDQWGLQTNKHISGRALWGNHRQETRLGSTLWDQIGAGENSGNHHIWISWFSQKKSDMIW